MQETLNPGKDFLTLNVAAWSWEVRHWLLCLDTAGKVFLAVNVMAPSSPGIERSESVYFWQHMISDMLRKRGWRFYLDCLPS